MDEKKNQSDSALNISNVLTRHAKLLNFDQALILVPGEKQWLIKSYPKKLKEALPLTPELKNKIFRMIGNIKSHFYIHDTQEPEHPNEKEKIEIQEVLLELLPGARSLIGLPFPGKGGHPGLLVLYRDKPIPHSAKNIEDYQYLANLLATLMDNDSGIQQIKTFNEEEAQKKIENSLAEIVKIINSKSNLDEILQFITQQIKEIMGASAVAIFAIQPDGKTLKIQAAQGFQQNFIQNMELPIDQGALGHSITTGQPVAINNVFDFSIKNGKVYLNNSKAFIEDKLWLPFSSIFEKSGSFITTPIFVRGKAYGGLILHYPQPQNFSNEQIDLATMLANHAVLAIENFQLQEQREKIAVLQERNRIARDLHDSISQVFFGITLETQSAIKMLNNNCSDDIEKTLEVLAHTLELTQMGVTEMRSLIYELRPDIIEKDGLIMALKHYLNAIRIRRNMEILEEFCEEPDISLTSKESLFRVVQEAINNTLKHAQASKITFKMIKDNHGLLIKICDDGKGFDPQQDHPGHFGLKTMQERIEDLHGKLTIHKHKNQGACIEILFPKT